MDKIITDIIQRVIDDSEVHIKYVEQYMKDMRAILDELAELSVTLTCAICGNEIKDVSSIIEKNPPIIYWHSGSNDLIAHLNQAGYDNGKEFYSKCYSHRIEVADLWKNPLHTWDPDLNPPGRRTKAWRILDEHPQIDELWFGSNEYDYNYYTARIKDKWYKSLFAHVTR